MKLFDEGLFRTKRISNKHIYLRLCSVIICIVSLIIALASDSALALKNPSAVYCRALGYEYMTIHEERGARGLCKLTDGQTVDAWDFITGKVAQEFSYCKKMGMQLKQ